MQDREQVITYICGSNDEPHIQIAYLSGSTSAAMEETLKALEKLWCPACRRKLRQIQAKKYTDAFNLPSFPTLDARHLELAEAVRGHLLHIFLLEHTEPDAIARLVALIEQCVEVDFWISHRMLLWDERLFDTTVADLRTRVKEL